MLITLHIVWKIEPSWLSAALESLKSNLIDKYITFAQWFMIRILYCTFNNIENIQDMSSLVRSLRLNMLLFNYISMLWFLVHAVGVCSDMEYRINYKSAKKAKSNADLTVLVLLSRSFLFHPAQLVNSLVFYYLCCRRSDSKSIWSKQR